MKRRKINSKRSRRLFSSTASRTHRTNVFSGVMRGGIRL